MRPRELSTTTKTVVLSPASTMLVIQVMEMKERKLEAKRSPMEVPIASPSLSGYSRSSATSMEFTPRVQSEVKKVV